MATYNINKIKLPNGDIVKLVDETSGYTTNTGTVTSVALTNASGESDFTITGSPITGSGTITIDHANTVTAKTTQALYPITFDKHGHITAAGTAVDPEDVYWITYTEPGAAKAGSGVDRTPTEVRTAYDAGKLLILRVVQSGDNSGAGLFYFLREAGLYTDPEVSKSAHWEYFFINYTTDHDGNNIVALNYYYLSENGGDFSVFGGTFNPASDNHSHGLITSSGSMDGGVSAVTPASGDYILISDNDNSNSIERGIAIGTGTTKYLREDGTWQTVSTSDTKVKMTSTTSGSEYPIILGPTSITSGNDYESYYNSSVTINADYQRITAKRLRINYDVNSSFTINQGSYQGTTSNNTPVVKFTSLKTNASGGTDKNVMISGVTTPTGTSSDYNNYAASKKYVDDAVSAGDTKVTNTLGTTTKYYVTGTTSSTTNTGTQYFDTGIYATTTAGQLNATTYKVNENVTLQWNSSDSSLDFIF